MSPSSTKLHAIVEPSISSSTILTSASLLPSLPSSITSPLASLSVLAFVILIHELGHFSAARSFNINVDEFSVGVGPKLFGFKRNVDTGKISFGKSKEDKGEEGDGVENVNKSVAVKNVDNDTSEKNEIEFNLRVIPLGGYVRFPENYNMTQEFQLEVQADEKRNEIDRIVKERRREDLSENGIFASLTNVIQSFTDKEKVKEERLLALEAMSKDLKQKEKPKSSSGWWTNIFKSKNVEKKTDERTIVIEEDGTVSTPPIEYYDDPNLLQNRGWVQRAVVLAGGVVFNILLAFTLYFGELTLGSGLYRPAFDQGLVVSSIPRPDGPSVGMLKRGDVILSLNGEFYTCN